MYIYLYISLTPPLAFTAMALKALGATSRRASKPYKPPRGLRWGLGVTSAVRPKWGGATGNVQTFGGYTVIIIMCMCVCMYMLVYIHSLLGFRRNNSPETSTPRTYIWQLLYDISVDSVVYIHIYLCMDALPVIII